MCDTCQDCDNLTLPIGATGADGADGAQGPQGPAGANGAVVLYNDLTPGTTNSVGTFAVFTVDKLYNVPTGTLAADGDKLEVVAMFTTQISEGSTAAGEYQMLIGGTDIAGGLFPNPYAIKYSSSSPAGSPNSHLKVKLDISRVDSTTLLIHSDSYAATITGEKIRDYHFTTLSLTVADLDTTPLTIQAKGMTYSLGGLFTCHQLNINSLNQ